ncbi:MAG: hypothetical protein KKC76_21350 [Proteobacteria bacterium]|nr:hypothetical protein [Pseudomonadota bacterium]MBU4296499.1 hypothetical protein [Pseudomonadota bacterium]MCG2745976.1 hypothetical protein [Desulfobulbaceae bacterium]
METKKMSDRLMWGAAIIAGLLTMSVFAQAGFRPEGPQSPEQALKRLQHDLDLTEEQSAKVRVFMDESAQQEEEEVLARYGLTREQFQLLQKDLHMARDGFFDKLQTVLTDEQQEECKRHGTPIGGDRPPSAVAAVDQ